jgi:hypothetical protein
MNSRYNVNCAAAHKNRKGSKNNKTVSGGMPGGCVDGPQVAVVSPSQKARGNITIEKYLEETMITKQLFKHDMLRSGAAVLGTLLALSTAAFAADPSTFPAPTAAAR